MKISVFSACPQLYDEGVFYQDAVRLGTFEQAFTQVKRGGAQAVEVAICAPDELDTEEMKAALRSTGMRISMFGTFYWCSKYKLSLLSERKEIAQQALDYFKSAIRIGASVGVPVGLGQLRGNAGNAHPISYYEDKLVDVLRDIAKEAERVNGVFTIEPQQRSSLNMINNTRAGLKIIERVGSDHFRMTYDLQQSYMEEDILEAIVLSRDVLQNLHFMDANHLAPSKDGILDFPAILKVLSACRFDGYLTVPLSAAELGEENDTEARLGKTTAYLLELIKTYC